MVVPKFTHVRDDIRPDDGRPPEIVLGIDRFLVKLGRYSYGHPCKNDKEEGFRHCAKYNKSPVLGWEHACFNDYFRNPKTRCFIHFIFAAGYTDAEETT